MKKILSILLVVLLAGLMGCQSEQDRKYDELVQAARSAQGSGLPGEMEIDYDAPNYIGPPKPDGKDSIAPAEGDMLSGKLVIKSYQQRGSTPAIDLLAREFMELHPHTEIVTEYDELWSDNMSRMERGVRREAFHARVRVEIASGEADYLLYGASEFLDYYALAKSGALTDLWELWQADPDIREAEYFMPVIEAFQVDSTLPLIPYGFFLEGIYLNKALLQEQAGDTDGRASVDAGDILAWYEGARQTRPELQLFFTAQGKDALFSAELPRYIGLENKSSAFDSPEFVRFLARTGDVVNDDPGLDSESEKGCGEVTDFEGSLRYQSTGVVGEGFEYFAKMGYSEYKNIVTKGRLSFALKTEVAMHDLLEGMQHKLEYVAGPFALASTDGHLGVTVLSETFAVPSSMKNKKLAWEFIKYCLGEREDLTFNRFGYTGQGYYLREAMPVNRANFVKMAEEMPQYIRDNFSAPGYDQLSYGPVDGKEMEAYMDRLLEQDPVNLGKCNMDIQDYLNEYYINKLTTPEQCAGKIQGRAYIWLHE